MKCLLVLMLVSWAMALHPVVHMSQRGPKKAGPDTQRLLHKFLMAKPGHWQDRRQLVSYQFNNCGDPQKEELLITQLTVSPDPVPTSGTLNITFKAQVKANVTSPLQTSLTLRKRLFGEWVTIPCIDGFGSCSYSDFCQTLGKISSCPQPFVDNKVPCKCPFPVGNYTLPGVGVKVDLPSELPEGGYSATVNMQSNGQAVGCYNIIFSVQ